MSANGKRARAPKDARTLLRSDNKLGGYDLPEGVLPDGEAWHPLTVRWWDHWRRSPQATQMASEPDWDFLLDTALIHHLMWSKGRWEFANEVRMRVSLFGATPAHRKQLKMELEVPEQYSVGVQKGDAIISDLNSRRDRLAVV